MHPDPTTLSRFWAKVDKTDSCWLWTAALFAGKEYGVFQYQKKAWRAHRFAYEITHGPIPEGLFVCHHCDNPRCVNPEHLFLGTPKDNMADMVRKGRSLKGTDNVPPANRARGSRVNTAKLTAKQVTEIRWLCADGDLSQSEIGARYGIKQSAVSKIARRVHWKVSP